MFNCFITLPDGSIKTVDYSEGYLELSFDQVSYSIDEDANYDL